MTASTAVPPPADPRDVQAGGPGRGFIEELHGVRGIALCLVVLFHVFGQGRVSGGVDVFLFFSGFLLTASMYRRSLARQSGGVRRHYARTVLRLLPAAVVVLAATTIAILVLRPLSALPQDLREVRASLLYYENWELIRSQLAYGAAGPEASPLQHFWSLSLQGQFFLLWPLLVVALVVAGRRVARPWAVVTGGVLVLTVGGFVVAQGMVAHDQPVAYFHGASRWWELTAGGLLALVLTRWSLPAALRGAAGWCGLALILACGFVVDGAQAFPGPWVLLPLAGAALVLAGAGAPGGPRRLLQTRPLTWLADIAYELYLWHWPILVLVLVLQDRDTVGPRTAVLVVLTSLVAAWVTHVTVSRPVLRLRSASPRVVLVGAAAVVTIAAVAVTALVVRADDLLERSLDVSAYTLTDYPGAEAVRTPALSRDSYPVPVGPPPEVAERDDEPGMGSACWQDWRGEVRAIEWCTASRPGGQKVALVGGSRALMWEPTLVQAAADEGWDLVVTARGSCPLQERAVEAPCREWSDDVLSQLLAERPAAVFVEGTEVSPPDGEGREVVEERRVDAWRTLEDAGIEVFALRAGPRFEKGPPGCLLDVGVDRAEQCDVPAAALYADRSPFETDQVGSRRVHEIDLTPYFCPDGTCSAIVGNLISNRDRRHFTAAFARTLAPALVEQVGEAAPGLTAR